MSKAVCKDIHKKGDNPEDFMTQEINLTMLSLVVNLKHFSCKIETLETSLRNQDTRIVFSHCITSLQERELTDSMFGNFYFGNFSIPPSSS